MREVRFLQAIGPWWRSAPFLVLRLALAIAIAGAWFAATVAGAIAGSLLDAAGDTAAGRGAFWGAAAGFGLVAAAVHLARAQLLYRVRAGHIAVLVRLIDGDPVPPGRGQLAFAAATVRARFPDPSLLLALGQLSAGIVRAFSRALRAQPDPGTGAPRSGALRVAGAAASVCALRLDQALLAQALRAARVNPWAGARDGAVLFAQNHPRLLTSALGLAALGWLLTAVLFAAVLAPVSAVLAPVPGLGGVWTVALAVVLACSLASALVGPLTLSLLLQVWAAAVGAEPPRQEWAAKLNAATGGFRILGQEALGWVGGLPNRPDPGLPGRTAVS